MQRLWNRFLAALVFVLSSPLTFATASETPDKPLRAGIIGLDTSHVVAFTEFLNATNPEPDIAGVRGNVGKNCLQGKEEAEQY